MQAKPNVVLVQGRDEEEATVVAQTLDQWPNPYHFSIQGGVQRCPKERMGTLQVQNHGKFGKDAEVGCDVGVVRLLS